MPTFLATNAPPPERVTDLPRNNVPRAIAYVENQLARNSRISDDDLHVLLMLQDDAEALVTALQQLNDKRRASGLATFM